MLTIKTKIQPNSNISIVHFNGSMSKHPLLPLIQLNINYDINLQIPKNCCIFTVCSDQNKNQIKKYSDNQHIIISTPNKKTYLTYHNMSKLIFFNQFLKNTHYEKILFVDAFDVFFIKPLNKLFETYQQNNLITFGAEKNFFYHLDNKIQTKLYHKQFKANLQFQFINTGITLGHRNTLLTHTQEVIDTFLKDIYPNKNIHSNTKLRHCDQGNTLRTLFLNKKPYILDSTYILNTAKVKLEDLYINPK